MNLKEKYKLPDPKTCRQKYYRVINPDRKLCMPRSIKDGDPIEITEIETLLFERIAIELWDGKVIFSWRGPIDKDYL